MLINRVAFSRRWRVHAILLAWLLCADLLSANQAHAQSAAMPPAEPAGYRKSIDLAISEYEAGHFEKALRHFQRAHELFPNARTLRGIGMAQFELHEYAASASALEQALASSVKPIRGDLRQETERLLRRARDFIVDGSAGTRAGPSQDRSDGPASIEAGSQSPRPDQPPAQPHPDSTTVSLGSAAPPQAPPEHVTGEQSSSSPAMVADPVRKGEVEHTEPVRAAAHPSAHRHDGFMLRFTLGAGAASMSLGSEMGDARFSGLSGTFGFDIGGAVMDNLVLHLRLSSVSTFEPTVTINGRSTTARDASVTAVLVAPAISYYYMPINAYATIAMGLSQISLEDRTGESVDTDYGFGLNVDVGKEWWIEDQWSLGVAGRLWYTQLTDATGAYEERLALIGFAAMVSVTCQ